MIDLAVRSNLEAVDICNSLCAALDLNKRDLSSYLADKIHPNKEGQQPIVRALRSNS